ncbi:hypothetical protein MesoLj131c_11780 [Mesorhizobium sp. 131-3-5]|nr:hypothetical protein MesoLj131c_11780 [Mesorhizobium sp. 131-3-5]
MAPAEQRVHDICLAGAEIVEAEHVLQDALLGILRPNTRCLCRHQADTGREAIFRGWERMWESIKMLSA